jgi:NCS2 family nucleobase:cation symporter-2
MPPALHPLLESGILLSALTAIVLNVFFHGGKEDPTATLEAAKATDSH